MPESANSVIAVFELSLRGSGQPILKFVHSFLEHTGKLFRAVLVLLSAAKGCRVIYGYRSILVDLFIGQ